MHIFLQKQSKNLADEMIQEKNYKQLPIEEFKTPFERGLDKTNRWVLLSSIMPWNELAGIYSKALSKRMGRPALLARIVIGAIIIKHKLCLSDEEVIPAIQENPYLQYFLGFCEFSHKRPFDPSLFVTIRKRLGKLEFEDMTNAFIGAVNEVEKANKTAKKKTVKNNKQSKSSQAGNDESASDTQNDSEKHSGLLLLDATVAPADIKFPTDLDLLNKSREQSEKLIDALWQQVKKPQEVKPRTYSQKARKEYLIVSKKRKKSTKVIRKGIRKQLNFLNRNLKTINTLLDRFETKKWPLSYREQQSFWIIQELYRQQHEMYTENRHQINDRIVSVSQPHVRPIIRGKAKCEVEFGAKISCSVFNGYVFLDRLSWDAYHEASDLPAQVELFKKRFGFYPEAVVADNIYGTRENRNWLEGRGIRFSGKPLGRPLQETIENAAQLKADKKRRKKEAGIRNQIEGKFGEGKRTYDLDLVKAKLPRTSESWIAAILFVINLARWLRAYFFVPIRFCFKEEVFRLFLYVKELNRVSFAPVFQC